MIIPSLGDDLESSSHGKLPARFAVALLFFVAIFVLTHSFGRYFDGWGHYTMVSTENGTVGVLGSQPRRRMVNLIIGFAARDLSENQLKRLTVPKKYEQLLGLPPEESPSKLVESMQLYLLRRTIPKRYRRVSYDPKIPSDQFDQLIDSDRATAYPMNIFTLYVPDADHTSLFALSDMDRKRIVLVPSSHPLVPKKKAEKDE